MLAKFIETVAHDVRKLCLAEPRCVHVRAPCYILGTTPVCELPHWPADFLSGGLNARTFLCALGAGRRPAWKFPGPGRFREVTLANWARPVPRKLPDARRLCRSRCALSGSSHVPPCAQAHVPRQDHAAAWQPRDAPAEQPPGVQPVVQGLVCPPLWKRYRRNGVGVCQPGLRRSSSRCHRRPLDFLRAWRNPVARRHPAQGRRPGPGRARRRNQQDPEGPPAARPLRRRRPHTGVGPHVERSFPVGAGAFSRTVAQCAWPRLTLTPPPFCPEPARCSGQRRGRAGQRRLWEQYGARHRALLLRSRARRLPAPLLLLPPGQPLSPRHEPRASRSVCASPCTQHHP